jgi:hypothetical protein
LLGSNTNLNLPADLKVSVALYLSPESNWLHSTPPIV